MKVLHVNAVYGHGSTGTIVRDIAELCEKVGIESYVASPDPCVKEAMHGYVIGTPLDHKCHAVLSRIHGKQAYFSRNATKHFLKFIDNIKPDIVHLHNLHSNFICLNMLLAYLAKNDIRTIITLHDCWFYTGGCFHYTADGCKGWLDKCGVCPKGKNDPKGILGKATRKILEDRKRYFQKIPRLDVVGVSNWIAEEAKRTFFKNTNVVTIHNGVDMNVFKPTYSDIRTKLGLNDKYIILGPASKWLQPVNKSVLDYFSLNMKDDEVLLLFGCQDSKIQVPENIRLYGFTRNREELAALYTCADVFVNVTREDSLSLINVEAQACNTPVVTFDETGPKETVDGIYSHTVSVGDSKGLLDCVHNMRSENKPIDTIRDFVNEHYEVNSNYNKYLSLYKTKY